MTGPNRSDDAVREYARTLAGPAGRSAAGVGAARRRFDAPADDPGGPFDGSKEERFEPPAPSAETRRARRMRDRRREESESQNASWRTIFVWVLFGMAVVRSIDGCSGRKPEPPPPRIDLPSIEGVHRGSTRDVDRILRELAGKWEQPRVGTGAPPTEPQRDGR